MELNELLFHLKNNELEYFNEFYEKTKKNVLYMAYSILHDFPQSEDIMQDTYIKFLKHVSHLNTHQSILSYLMTIARNLSLNALKRRKREVVVDKDTLDVAVENDDKQNMNFELLDQIKKILNRDEFQIVILHVLNDLTHKEIASIMKKPLGTVTWSYSNAIQKIRKEIPYED